DGVAFVKRLGADAVVDGRGDDVLKIAREFAPNGIDAALVTAGGGGRDGGRAAVRGAGRGAPPNGGKPGREPTTKVRSDAYDGDGGREAIDKLNRLIEAGPFEVHVDRTFSLEEVAKAHAALTEHHLGKIALKIA